MKVAKRNIFTGYKYINLIKAISFTDFKLKYEGSVLGYFWSLARPLMLFAVMFVVFTQIFKVGGKIEFYPVYLLLGIVIFDFFTEVTSGAMTSIASKGGLIRKVYFPRVVLVISKSVTSLITFGLNLVAVGFFMVFTGVPFRWSILLFPLLVIEYLVFVTGVSLILSALYVKFRDLSHIWAVVTRALFYATPILYPLSIVPNDFAKIMMLSPIAQILQDSRYLIVTTQTLTAADYLTWRYLWIPYSLPFIILIAGIYIFEKSSAKFAEEV